MPTKKKRVGFIPRSDVLDLINKLSFESNLSISKIINILVEEALYKRGILNKQNAMVLNNVNKIFLDNGNSIKIKNDKKDTSNEFIDKDIYEKFLMYLQFQEKMKKRN